MKLLITAVWAFSFGVLALGQPADGIYGLRYQISATQIGHRITSQDGQQYLLGVRQSLDVQKAYLYSQNNENTTFYLSLTVPFDDSLNSSQYLLVVKGAAYRQTGSGASQGIESSIGFNIDGTQNARDVAAFFKTDPVYRRHPKHNLFITFAPTKPEFDLGEEVVVRLIIKNVGSNTVGFMQGGRNRAARDNQYVFSARSVEGQVADIGTSMHFGGLAQKRILKPGGVFEDNISLSKWFAFDQNGIFEVHGSYYLNFVDPEFEGYSTIWEDYATADFIVRIKGTLD